MASYIKKKKFFSYHHGKKKACCVARFFCWAAGKQGAAQHKSAARSTGSAVQYPAVQNQHGRESADSVLLRAAQHPSAVCVLHTAVQQASRFHGVSISLIEEWNKRRREIDRT